MTSVAFSSGSRREYRCKPSFFAEYPTKLRIASACAVGTGEARVDAGKLPALGTQDCDLMARHCLQVNQPGDCFIVKVVLRVFAIFLNDGFKGRNDRPALQLPCRWIAVRNQAGREPRPELRHGRGKIGAQHRQVGGTAAKGCNQLCF
ncbi:MAG: hypothetical protein RLZZ373_3252 [Pseudomonadota bacterium]